MHSRRKVLTRAHPCTYSSNALLKKARCEGGEGRTRGLTRRAPRGGRVCARLCVDRGVNKRYTNVSHLGVYPPPLLSPYPPSSLSLSLLLSFSLLPYPASPSPSLSLSLFLSSTSSRSCPVTPSRSAVSLPRRASSSLWLWQARVRSSSLACHARRRVTRERQRRHEFQW